MLVNYLYYTLIPKKSMGNECYKWSMVYIKSLTKCFKKQLTFCKRLCSIQDELVVQFTYEWECIKWVMIHTIWPLVSEDADNKIGTSLCEALTLTLSSSKATCGQEIFWKRRGVVVVKNTLRNSLFRVSRIHLTARQDTYYNKKWPWEGCLSVPLGFTLTFWVYGLPV